MKGDVIEIKVSGLTLHLRELDIFYFSLVQGTSTVTCHRDNMIIDDFSCI